MKLIIINGPCGVGKSVVAQKLHDIMPLSFLLDIDAQNRFISHYREFREERWMLSVAISKAILEACFSQGRDVILEKIIYAGGVLDEYRAIAEKHGTEVKEFILWAPLDVVMSRAANRGWHEGGLLTPEKCELFWRQITDLKAERPQATVIDTADLSVDQVFEKMKQLL